MHSKHVAVFFMIHLHTSFNSLLVTAIILRAKEIILMPAPY